MTYEQFQSEILKNISFEELESWGDRLFILFD